MDVDAYLARMGFDRPRTPDRDTLRRLHVAHMLTVPFENLDIALGHDISLSLPDLFAKVVERRRGGFCYELNGLFCELLHESGFRVDRLSARVFGSNGPGPDFDHMLLLVHLDEPWIADVGFGDSFVEPLRLEGDEVEQRGRSYRVAARVNRYVLQQREPDASWATQYDFTLKSRRLDEFAPRCRFQQSSPESPFTRKSVCSRATHDGRVTLSNRRLIETRETREERVIADADEYRARLREHFGMELGPEDDVERILSFGNPLGQS